LIAVERQNALHCVITDGHFWPVDKRMN